LPLGRAFPTTERDRLIRELVLLLKTGHLDVQYFRSKYGIDIRDVFRTAFDRLQRDGWLAVTGDSIDCTPDGLMQIDRHLPAFFDPQYISSRYT
jgi:oxygen-independent coproporphyrinogen-3 oxidase